MNDQQQLQIVRASVHRFIGRLSQDPALRFFDSGNAVANSRLLVNQPGARRDDGSEPDGFKLEIWGSEQAQAFADACAKGSLVDVVGRVKIETWTDNTGQEREQPTIRIEQWALLRPAGQGQPQQQQQAAPAPAAAQRTAPAPAPAPVRRAPF